jgi:pimeloyl-ACP methyl ester carboxylesterase|tara:strand:+ start:1068 stop:2126 length:1059 start_codon:yes stop_codon:yes gene_type:complete
MFSLAFGGSYLLLGLQKLPRTMRVALLLAAGSLELAWTLAVPSANPQGVPNQLWSWRGQQIRYQAFGDPAAKQSVLLVHGLFVNADHWRRNVPALAESGYRVYSIDLLGYGYSSKPDPYGEVARGLSGEKGRALTDVDTELWSPLSPGGTRMASVAQGHPLGSCYNFFTWAEQLCDFVDEVVHKEEDGQHDGQQDGRQDGRQQGVAQSSVALVCNSIGTISGLQAAVDRPELFNGVAVVNPNFRELHVAEQPAPLRPITTAVQSLLRRYGKPLFDALAKPATVKQILREPYSDATQVTDELVDVLLTPLLTEGSAEVSFSLTRPMIPTCHTHPATPHCPYISPIPSLAGGRL